MRKRKLDLVYTPAQGWWPEKGTVMDDKYPPPAAQGSDSFLCEEEGGGEGKGAHFSNTRQTYKCTYPVNEQSQF